MKTFLSHFLRRLTFWWLPIAAPWCMLFLGVGSPDEIEGWFNELTLRRFFRSMTAGLIFSLPIALFAALSHTVALYRDSIFFADVRRGGRRRIDGLTGLGNLVGNARQYCLSDRWPQSTASTPDLTRRALSVRPKPIFNGQSQDAPKVAQAK